MSSRYFYTKDGFRYIYGFYRGARNKNDDATKEYANLIGEEDIPSCIRSRLDKIYRSAPHPFKCVDAAPLDPMENRKLENRLQLMRQIREARSNKNADVVSRIALLISKGYSTRFGGKPLPLPR